MNYCYLKIFSCFKMFSCLSTLCPCCCRSSDEIGGRSTPPESTSTPDEIRRMNSTPSDENDSGLSDENDSGSTTPPGYVRCRMCNNDIRVCIH